jgi:hypothetical protein
MWHSQLSTTEIYAQIDTPTLQRIHRQVSPVTDLLAQAEAEKLADAEADERRLMHDQDTY